MPAPITIGVSAMNFSLKIRENKEKDEHSLHHSREDLKTQSLRVRRCFVTLQLLRCLLRLKHFRCHSAVDAPLFPPLKRSSAMGIDETTPRELKQCY